MLKMIPVKMDVVEIKSVVELPASEWFGIQHYRVVFTDVDGIEYSRILSETAYTLLKSGDGVYVHKIMHNGRVIE